MLCLEFRPVALPDFLVERPALEPRFVWRGNGICSADVDGRASLVEVRAAPFVAAGYTLPVVKPEPGGRYPSSLVF